MVKKKTIITDLCVTQVALCFSKVLSKQTTTITTTKTTSRWVSGQRIIARQPFSNNQVAPSVYEAGNFAYQPQSAASSRTSNASLSSPNPAVFTLPGKWAPGPKFHIPLRCCRHSAAPTWYARILSTVLAFYFFFFFSGACYFTFKLGRHWRTGRLFCIPISSDEGGVVFCIPSSEERRLLIHAGVQKYMCLCLWQKIKPSFNSHCTRSSVQTSDLYFFTPSRRPQTKSLMSMLGLSGRKLCCFFYKRAGRTQQSQGPVRGGCLTGHNRYKSSGGSPCQLHFPGENRCRYVNTWTPQPRSSLSKVDLRVKAGPTDLFWPADRTASSVN